MPLPRVLDACAGTGLLTLDLARRGAAVTAADAAPAMLAVARDRLAAAGLPLRTVVADLSEPGTAATLGGPYEAITLGFGLRYFADPGALLRPLRELLAPGGRLVVIEAVRPPRDLLGAAAGLYFFEVAPRLGAALAGRAALYEFLTASTRALGGADDVAAHLRRAGFALYAAAAFRLWRGGRPGRPAPTEAKHRRRASPRGDGGLERREGARSRLRTGPFAPALQPVRCRTGVVSLACFQAFQMAMSPTFTSAEASIGPSFCAGSPAFRPSSVYWPALRPLNQKSPKPSVVVSSLAPDASWAATTLAPSVHSSVSCSKTAPVMNFLGSPM